MRWLIASVLLSATTLYGADFDSAKYQNWHHWRGPEASGFAPKADPPTEWSEDKNIKWKAPLEGKGSATPIVWKDQVFVVTSIKLDKKVDPSELPKLDSKFEKKTERPLNYYQFVVYSFDRTTGKQQWRVVAREAVPHEGTHQTHSYAAGSPTTDGETLFVSFGSQGIYAYSFEGKQLWKREIGLINSRLGWGEAVTPVVHGDSLLLNWDQESDSKLICLDKKTGKTKWEVNRDEKTSWNTPLILEKNGKTQVIMNGTNHIRSYDLATGKLIWEGPPMTVNAIPSPVTDGEKIYVMSGYRGSAAVALPIDSTGSIQDSQVVWKYAKGTPYVPSPVLVENRLYFTQANTQMLTILNAKTGEALVDRERLPSVRSFYGSPIAASGKVYFASQDGITVVLKVGDKMDVLAVNRLDDKFDASPVAVGKQLFLRGEKSLYCIEAK